MKKPAFILTDIEGTTTPKSFVFDVLFPFFTQHITAVASLEGDKEADAAFALIRATMLEEDGQSDPSMEQLIQQLRLWVETDRKHPGLKALQGLMWDKGYQEGTLKGIVYDDVPEMLEVWKAERIELGVYSSGSVKAQKLLFGYSNAGDLCPYFSAYFDTSIGYKRETASYINIANQLKISPEAILFLSDIAEELDAAQEAGMATLQLVRDDTTVPSENHTRITTFKDMIWK
jgi:enolase-phosphatase E1